PHIYKLDETWGRNQLYMLLSPPIASSSVSQKEFAVILLVGESSKLSVHDANTAKLIVSNKILVSFFIMVGLVFIISSFVKLFAFLQSHIDAKDKALGIWIAPAILPTFFGE